LRHERGVLRLAANPPAGLGWLQIIEPSSESPYKRR
jgi:hypothetical protein